jgi:hypothetical protein
MQKNQKQKSRDTVPLKGALGEEDSFKHNEQDHRRLLSKKCRNNLLFAKNCETIFWVILPLFGNFSAKQTKNCLKNCHWRLCLEWFFGFGLEIR